MRSTLIDSCVPMRLGVVETIDSIGLSFHRNQSVKAHRNKSVKAHRNKSVKTYRNKSVKAHRN